MAKEDQWFKFYYKLFLISTQGWKDDEVGAYVRLLSNQFDRGGLPDDEAELKKLITSHKKNWPALSKKFKKCDDGLLRNDFMSDVRKERDEKSIKNKEIGSLGGRPRKNRTITELKPNAFKNESHIYSSSLSDSVLGNEEGMGEEKPFVANGRFFKLDDPDLLGVPDRHLDNSIMLISITKKKNLTKEEVLDLFEVFKCQNINGTKYYESSDAVFSHFLNWLKTQKFEINNGKRNSGGSSSAKQEQHDAVNDLIAEVSGTLKQGNT
jgi:uncharacterized protein YdaU (DUF1376 family)